MVLSLRFIASLRLLDRMGMLYMAVCLLQPSYHHGFIERMLGGYQKNTTAKNKKDAVDSKTKYVTKNEPVPVLGKVKRQLSAMNKTQ